MVAHLNYTATHVTAPCRIVVLLLLLLLPLVGLPPCYFQAIQTHSACSPPWANAISAGDSFGNCWEETTSSA